MDEGNDARPEPPARTLSLDEHIDELVAAAPPLSPAQRDRLAVLLGGQR